ncbi:MAG: hypothetical protein EAZ12_08260 [Sphingobacteriia bacterium]|nr:MAG: hypothetical protein EAZ12_08260 [Sphingobacteriia bacterium]
MRQITLYIVVAAHLLLFLSCAQGIYKLAGGKSPRVENASTVQAFLNQKDSLPALHTYIHQTPLDSASLLNFNTAWSNKFFDPNGNALVPKNENNWAPFFAHTAANPDSLSIHFEKLIDTNRNLNKALAPLRTLDRKNIFAENLIGNYVVIIPWMKYALYKDMREEVLETAKIIRQKNIPIQIILMNTDFQESWGLPLGKKVDGKYIWNKSERSVEATYNIVPLINSSN